MSKKKVVEPVTPIRVDFNCPFCGMNLDKKFEDRIELHKALGLPDTDLVYGHQSEAEEILAARGTP